MDGDQRKREETSQAAADLRSSDRTNERGSQQQARKRQSDAV